MSSSKRKVSELTAIGNSTKKPRKAPNVFTKKGIQELTLTGGTGARWGDQPYVIQFSCSRRWRYAFAYTDVRFTYEGGTYTLEYTKHPPDAKSETKTYSGSVVGCRLEGLRYYVRDVSSTNVVLSANWEQFNDYMCCKEHFEILVRFDKPVTELNGISIGEEAYSDCSRSCGKCHNSWGPEKCYNCDEETYQMCQYCDIMMCDLCYVQWGDDSVCVNCFQKHYIEEHKIVKGDPEWDYENIGFNVMDHKFTYHCPSDEEEK
jgi:hypothetical protein